MRRYVIAAALVCAVAPPARAQDDLLSFCARTVPQQSGVSDEAIGQFRFLCAQVVNSLANVQPTVGIAFSGGNPVLGTATTMGRRLGIMPRVSVTARANVAFADVPDLFDDVAGRISDGQTTVGAMETTGVPVGSLQGDISLGLFNGLSLGPAIGGVGAIDLLGSVAVLPRISDIGMAKAIVNVGAGARIGLLRQGLVVPGVSVSGMYRRMGDLSFGDRAAGDAGEFSTDLETLSVRAIASKGVLPFDFAIGAGYDRYRSDVGLLWSLDCGTTECRSAGIGSLSGEINGKLSTAAWNVFGDIGLNLLFLNIVGELGYQKATDVVDLDDLRRHDLPAQNLTNEDLKGGRLFGSIGLRVSI